MFKVGDTVKVTTHRWGVDQHGVVGIIFEIQGGDMPFRLRATDGKLGTGGRSYVNCYRADDLSLVKAAQLIATTFTLEEITSYVD